MRRIARVVDAIPSVVHEETVRRCGREDSCILQARVAIAVLHRFEIVASVITTNCYVFNPAYTRRVEAGQVARNLEELESFGDGSWTIGLGLGDPAPGRYAGHLIVGSRENRWIMDPSIVQANRPRRGIVLEPLVMPAPASFWHDRERYWFKHASCAVGYQIIDNDAYFGSPDWIDPKRSAPIIAAAIRRLSAIDPRPDPVY
jgi:hypothetical protein